MFVKQQESFDVEALLAGISRLPKASRSGGSSPYEADLYLDLGFRGSDSVHNRFYTPWLEKND